MRRHFLESGTCIDDPPRVARSARLTLAMEDTESKVSPLLRMIAHDLKGLPGSRTLYRVGAAVTPPEPLPFA